MEVMFSGFDGEGWYLVILGCRGESEAAQSWPKNAKISWGGGLAWLERERREKMGLSFGCIF